MTTHTVGGIVLPESAVKKNNEALIIAVGQGRRLSDGTYVKPAVKEGDTVLLSDSYDAHKVTIDSKEYELLRESDLLGVLAPAKK